MFKIWSQIPSLSNLKRICDLCTWVLKWFLKKESGLMKKKLKSCHRILFKILFYLNCIILCTINSRNTTQLSEAFLCMFFISFLSINCHFKLMHQFMFEHPCIRIGLKFPLYRTTAENRGNWSITSNDLSNGCMVIWKRGSFYSTLNVTDD